MRDPGFYDAMAAQAAVRHGVPVSFVLAVIGTESSFEVPPPPPRWEPKVGEYAYGPMQILLSTARDVYPGISAAELADPERNVDVGAAYIRALMDRVGSDFRSVYSAYNSGNPERWRTSEQVRSNVDRALAWLETVAPAETISAGVLAAGAVLALWLWKRRKQ